jgi:ComF family protein
MQLLKGKRELPIQLGGIPNTAGIHSGLLRKLIIKLKQTEDPLLAHDLSYLLLAYSKDLQPVELIIPMPLHKKRRCQRGFNQSELLARSLSSLLSIPLSMKALSRIKDTRSQRGLHRDQRWRNMQAAFAARSEVVRGKTVMLVDDVYTSGATMQSASQSLLDAGAANVIEICIAIAPLLRSAKQV